MKRIEYYLKSAEIYSNLAISEQNFDRKTTYQTAWPGPIRPESD